MPQVKIYSTTWCAFCRAEKQFLTAKNIPFQDVDVEADPAAAEEMVHLTDQMGVPVTLITHDDGHQAAIIGFDQATLTKELNLT